MGDDNLKPLGELELWNRPSPGHVATWVQATVALSSVLGIMVAGVAAWTLWRIGGRYHDGDRGTFVLLPMFLMATAVVVTAFPDGTLSRFVRLAVALPVLHAVALIVALLYLPHLDMPRLGARTPLMEAVPAELVFGSGLAGFAVLGRQIGGKREWAHAFVMLALAYLLLLGLWLPIASQVPVRADRYGYHLAATLAALEEQPVEVVLLALSPPLVLAALYTALAVRAPAFAHRLRAVVAVALVGLFSASMVLRLRSNHGAFLVHDNTIHLLLAAVGIAIVATATLAVTTWLAGRRALRKLATKPREGAISDEDDGAVACLQITSWLRGPRLWMRSFVAHTAGELLRVPSGATLATALPKISSAMRTGEAVVILDKRDPITLGGFVERDVGDSPFRATRMTVPGPDGITIGHRAPMSTPLESMLLAAWRPAVAYLLILVAVAIPSLAGLFVEGRP